MKLRYIFSLMKMMRTPGLYKIIKDWQSCIRFHFIHSALDSGLIEVLKTPQSFNDLIKELKVKREDLLHAILDVGISTGELSFKNGLYKLKGKISKSLITEKGEALGALIQANVTYYNSAYREFADRMRGGELSDDLENIGDLVAKVSKLQEPLIKNFIHYAVKGKNSMNLLEIGCGSGTFMKTAFKINGNTVGLGIDCDDAVVKQAKNNMEKWGLINRFNIAQGDIRTFDIKSFAPFDLITLYNIIYYFEPEERGALIKKLKSNLSSQGKIAVLTNVQSNGKDPASANLNLVNCSLKGVTPVPEINSLKKLFKDSGFHNIETTQIMPGSAFYSILAS
ncbi:MAG: methyltransferase domain-containing protein [Desulfobacteraceae bacterium]|nr:methyltransferase domain-containing protein [Desulfobacteraceae bacterium]